jgi:hypothetical protein
MSNWPEVLRKHKWKRSLRTLIPVYRKSFRADAAKVRAFQCERCGLIMQFEEAYILPPRHRQVIFLALNPLYQIGEIYVYRTDTQARVWQLENYCQICECGALVMKRALK